MGFFMGVLQYFKKIGLAESRADTKNLLFTEKAVIPNEGGIFNRIVNDRFPQSSKIKKYSEIDLEEFYKTTLHPKMLAHKADMKEFCMVLANGLREVLDSDQLLPRFRNSKDAGQKLVNYLKTRAQMSDANKMSSQEFGLLLYCAVYFMMEGCIPQQYAELINGLQRDREEFMQSVVTKFGCSGKPGVYAIYNLADRENPNSIALYEAGELEYYGKGFLPGVPNYAQAYKYYKKAVEGKVYNPLAGWSLGYVLYYYRDRDKRENELRDAYIPEIHNFSAEQRKQMAIPHLLTSLSCGCPNAANVLAAIADDPAIPSIYKIQMKSAEEYLCIASDGGYVYAKNTLADRCLKRAATLSGAEKEELLKKGYAYLKESADLGEPWAMNKYGLMLYDQGRPGAAYGYFRRAARARHAFAGLNLLQKYYLPDLAQGSKRLYQDEVSLKLIHELWALCRTSTDKKLLNDLATLEETYADIFAQLR